jgi:hypothetical protein
VTARADVRCIERVRATLCVLGIGELGKLGVVKPEAISLALNAARSGLLYRSNAYAADVSRGAWGRACSSAEGGSPK